MGVPAGRPPDTSLTRHHAFLGLLFHRREKRAEALELVRKAAKLLREADDKCTAAKLERVIEPPRRRGRKIERTAEEKLLVGRLIFGTYLKSRSQSYSSICHKLVGSEKLDQKFTVDVLRNIWQETCKDLNLPPAHGLRLIAEQMDRELAEKQN